MTTPESIVYQFADARPALKNFNGEEHHLAMSLVIESAEVLELDKLKEAFDEEEFRRRMAGEMADVFIYLLEMSRFYDIDLVASTIEKVMHNHERFPEEHFVEGDFARTYLDIKRRRGERH